MAYNFESAKAKKKNVLKINSNQIDFLKPEQKGNTPNRKLVFQKLGESWRSNVVQPRAKSKDGSI